MKTAYRPSGREPDIIFVARENLSRLKPTFLDGAADVAIEVISPESQARDRGDKFYEYEKGGVREYWLIDPARKQAEFYSLNENGIYQSVALADGVFRSMVIEGFNFRVEWLWQEPLPPVLNILREWKLI
jgi:Uma2 family endonuclease